MLSKLLAVIFVLFAVSLSFGQAGEAPNYANSSTLPPGSALASKQADNLVNLFTGRPNVSIPIYSFKNNSGLAISVSLDYSGGGVQVGEGPGHLGLSWFLNAGGSITRIVRGMPDDMPTNGFLYASAIPADWRSNGNKYYHDSLDSQQDIFQYNFSGHSGKFFIGKNGDIITVPLSKLKIIPAYQSASLYNQTLKSFRIIAEDGVKYDFEAADRTSFTPELSIATASGYYGVNHSTSWSLTRIISPFSADTIKLNYITGGGEYSFKLPQITFVKSDGTRVTPINSPAQGNFSSKKLSSIELPDRTLVSFIYGFDTKYNQDDYALSKIKISDTAFRFGYLLEYDSTRTYWTGGSHGQGTLASAPARLRLKSVTPYTSVEKQQGYKFEYNELLFPKIGSYFDSIQNKRDYWGFYNGRVNPPDTLIPKIPPYTWGADRSPSFYEALGNSLRRFSLPTGGYILYVYELNDHYPYTTQHNSISIAAQTSSQNNITLNQIYNNRHQVTFLLDKSIARIGSAPVSGGGNLNVFIKNTAGTITYLSTSISLYDLFYSGMRSISFNIDNGNYRLETSLAAGTSVSGNLPLDIKWQNRTANTSINADPSGGIRVAAVYKHNSNDGIEGNYDTYKYILEDGKSSGFLGDIPRYDFPFRRITINGGTTTEDLIAVTSEPLTTTGFVLGSPVGYSRVEIIRNSSSGDLGKEVQEFTDLKDVNSNMYPTSFPYTPQDLRAWGLGLPKRISIYDSSGSLVSRTVNTIQFDTAVYISSDFKSIKLGNSQTTFYGNPGIYGTSRTKTFIGEEYYLTSGRAYVISSKDTLIHPNSTMSTMWQDIEYDNNFNVTKVTASYDKTRALVKEQRMYYPYNYTVGGGIGMLRDSAIISQVVSTETWITGDGNPRITGGMMTSFRAIGNNEVKPDTIYSFESNKPIAQATITTFNPAKLNRNPTFFKPQTYFTSYDNKGNLSEVKSLVTGLSNAVITDYDQQYATAKVSNAVQADIAYTSFESTGTGNWTIGNAARDVTDKITGKRSYNLTYGNVAKSGLTSGQNYLLTFWAKNTANVSVNGTPASSAIATQNNWNLYSLSLTGITSVILSGSGLIDELRLHPRDANMETHAYEPLIGVISSTDANNTVVYNEYDKLNRLKLIRDKDRNIIKRFDYSDTTMNVSSMPVWVGFEKRCSPTIPGQIDSLYRDTNPFSDSSGYVKSVYQGYLDCSCAEIAGNPEYAIINGVCERGTWTVTSSVDKKCTINGLLQNAYECTYRYCFSNGSQSTYFEKICSPTACTVNCFIPFED